MSGGGVAVVAAAAVSAAGFEWRGLADALEATDRPPVRTRAVPDPIPAHLDPADVRQQRQMSRAARMAAIAARRALTDAAWTPTSAGEGAGRADVGYFLGVGASGGSIDDLAAVLRASVDGGRLSLARLGTDGLSATNPVATFQLLNNFTLCHSAILEGTGGPNAAFFSRGGGTVAALMEAIHAVRSGAAERALAGGADSAHHPLTAEELARAGLEREGLVPGEGAAVLALARATPDARALAFVERCVLLGARADSGAVATALDGATDADLVVIAPWGDPARVRLRDLVATRLPRAAVLDATAGLGESLAATPALAWAAALDRIVSGAARRALAISLGVDRQIGVVEISGAGR